NGNRVGWDAEDDPENPKNWSFWTKWLQICLLIVPVFTSSFGFTVMAGPAAEIMGTLRVHNSQLVTFAITAYTLGQFFGQLIILPLHRKYGIRNVLLLHLVLFPTANICCALSQNAGMLISFRFLSGLTSTFSFLLGYEASIEMFDAYAMGLGGGILAISATIGTTVGLVSGSFLVARLGWQWAFWITAITSGGFGLPSVFLLRETSKKVLLTRKAIRLRKETFNQALYAEVATEKLTRLYQGVWDTYSQHLSKPSLVILYIHSATFQGSIHLIYTTLGYVFLQQYSLAGSHISVAATGIAVSITISAFLLSPFTASSSAWTIQTRALYAKVIGSLMMATLCEVSGFITYGWTAEYHIDKILPILSLSLIPLGGQVSVSCPSPYFRCTIFVVDLVSKEPTRYIAHDTIRLLFCAVLPLGGIPLYRSIGVGWGNTLLGLLNLFL
ncbi:MFS general substrate transporter, partial [Paraphaeosphaeria sporulosa]